MNAESQTKPWLPETFFLCSNGSLCLINYLTKNQKGVLKIYIGREGAREESVEHRGVLGQWVDSLWSCDVAGEEGDDREWDGWMASSTRWTWVWASSGRWWRTAKPGMLQSMGLERVRHDLATELNWVYLIPGNNLILELYGWYLNYNLNKGEIKLEVQFFSCMAIV